MRVGIEVRGDLRQIMQRTTEQSARAVSLAVASAGIATQGALRSRTTAALGRAVGNAWRLSQFPRGRPSLGAAAVVFTRAPNIIAAFSSGRAIRPQEGGSLSIPTAAAIQRMGRKRFTPRQFTQRTGIDLRHIYRRGKPSLLIGDNVRVGPGGRFAPNVRRRQGRAFSPIAGRVQVVFFLLLQGVRLPRLLNLDDAARQAASRLQAAITSEMEGVAR